MKLLISYTYRAKNEVGFANQMVISPNGQVTYDQLMSFQEQVKDRHEVDHVVILNVIRLDG